MKPGTKSIIVLASICVCAAIGMALTFEITTPHIEKRKKEKLLSALQEVLPMAEEFKEEKKISALFADKKTGVLKVYEGLDKKGKRIGCAFLVSWPGFQGFINLICGMDLDNKRLTGFKILEHLETPGLGARIEEDWFADQFKHKSLSDAFRPGEDVQAITGATISSNAVSEALKKGMEEVLAAYEKN